MKLTEIILQATAPTQDRAIWAKPSNDEIVELRVFNNGAWRSTSVSPDLSPYMKTSDFNAEIAKYLLKTDASTLYQTKEDNSLSTTSKTIVGAINEILPKATGVGRAISNGGEIFNAYEGAFENTASGEHSHAEGYWTKALGRYSHAEGYSATASGDFSHAAGNSTTASGMASCTEGYYTKANNDYEHAEGSYNASNTGSTDDLKTRHSVGIGDIGVARKNAHEIMANGDHYVYGVGGYDGTNAVEDTSKTLQEVINNKAENFTAGTGLEMTPERVLHVILDTTVFYVVETLPIVPTAGNENKICLVPTDNVSTLAPEPGLIKNEYTEYIWTGSNWEELGKYYSEVDLTPYLKSTDAATTYLSKTDATSTYLNKTDASSTYLSKTDAASTYETVSHASSTYATAANLNSAVSRITAIENKQTVVTEVPTLTAAYTIPANATMVEKIYMITIGATTYDVTGATGIKWAGGVAPSVSANSILVVSVLNNLATWQTFI